MRIMAEGVADSRGNIAGGGLGEEGRPPEPAADPIKAPKGWTWDRRGHEWVPRKRAAPSAAGQDGSGNGPGAAPPDGDQAAEQAGGDPPPAWQRDEVQDAAADAAPPFELTGDDRADVQALIALLYAPIAEPLAEVDPYCFGSLAEAGTVEDMTGAITDIVARSERISKWALSATGLMPWVKIATILRPVGVAVWRHHIVHSVEVDLDREARTMNVRAREWDEQYPVPDQAAA
jgi:hypothetical protein